MTINKPFRYNEVEIAGKTDEKDFHLDWVTLHTRFWKIETTINQSFSSQTRKKERRNMQLVSLAVTSTYVSILSFVFSLFDCHNHLPAFDRNGSCFLLELLKWFKYIVSMVLLRTNIELVVRYVPYTRTYAFALYITFRQLFFFVFFRYPTRFVFLGRYYKS